MPAALVLVAGLVLAFIGVSILRVQPVHYTHAKALGLFLLIAGEVLLFRVAWWWAVVGLVLPSAFHGIRSAREYRVPDQPEGPNR